MQPSKKRVFSDYEYKEDGAIIQEDLSDCDLIVGIKEVPVDKFIPDKTYLFFSHTIKVLKYCSLGPTAQHACFGQNTREQNSIDWLRKDNWLEQQQTDSLREVRRGGRCHRLSQRLRLVRHADGFQYPFPQRQLFL